MSQHVINLTGRAFHVDQVGLDAISAKIGPQRRVKVLRVIFHHRAQGAQLDFSPFRRTSYAGQEVGAVIGDELAEIKRAIARSWHDRVRATCGCRSWARSRLQIGDYFWHKFLVLGWVAFVRSFLRTVPLSECAQRRVL